MDDDKTLIVEEECEPEKDAETKPDPDPESGPDPEDVCFETGFGDPDGSATPIPPEVGLDKMDKLSHRVTFMAVVVGILIVAVAFFIYFDYRGRLAQIRETGDVKVDGLSKNFKQNVELFREQVEDTAKDMDKKLAAIKELVEKNQASIEANKKTLKQAKALAEQADKLAKKLDKDKTSHWTVKKRIEKERKALEKSLAGLKSSSEKSIESLEQDLRSTKILISNTEDSMARYDTAIEVAEQRIAALDTLAKGMETGKVDKIALDALMAQQEKEFSDKLADLDRKMRVQDRSLENQINQMGQAGGKSKTGSAKKTSNYAITPGPATGRPVAEEVLEQDLTP